MYTLIIIKKIYPPNIKKTFPSGKYKNEESII